LDPPRRQSAGSEAPRAGDGPRPRQREARLSGSHREGRRSKAEWKAAARADHKGAARAPQTRAPVQEDPLDAAFEDYYAKQQGAGTPPIWEDDGWEPEDAYQYVEGPPGRNLQQATVKFEDMDLNGDGVITREEYEEAIRRFERGQVWEPDPRSSQCRPELASREALPPRAGLAACIERAHNDPPPHASGLESLRMRARRTAEAALARRGGMGRVLPGQPQYDLRTSVSQAVSAYRGGSYRAAPQAVGPRSTARGQMNASSKHGRLNYF